MERIKNILLVCALVALVAPAMAADFFVQNGVHVDGAGNLLTGYYDTAPDATEAETFRADYQTMPYDINASPNPYYVIPGTAAAVLPGATDTLRFQQVTTDEVRVRTALNVATTYIGDSWFPLGDNTPIFGDQQYRVLANYSTGDFNFGRNPAEDFDFAANGLTLPTASVSVFWSVRDGYAFNADAVRMVNSDATARAGYTANPFRTNLSILTASTGSRTSSVNIGDMHLSDSVLFMHASTGTWNITGDIQEQGELLMLLYGRQNIGGPVYGAASGEGATLNIKWSTLLDMIDNGQLYLWDYAGDKAWARVRIGYEFDYDAVTTGGGWDASKVTLANMYDKLDIVDLGGGMVQVHAIPEPATLALLGIGAVAAFRRKR